MMPIQRIRVNNCFVVSTHSISENEHIVSLSEQKSVQHACISMISLSSRKPYFTIKVWAVRSTVEGSKVSQNVGRKNVEEPRLNTWRR